MLTIEWAPSRSVVLRSERGSPYVLTSGQAQFRVHPDEPAYRGVADLDLAPADSDGMVRFDADVLVMRPRDSRAGNGRILLDVVNRGDKRLLAFFNDAPLTNSPSSEADVGNGFLMREGYTLVWCGWQGDVLPGDDRMALRVPSAVRGDRPITGVIRKELSVDAAGVRQLPLSGNAYTRSYPVADEAGAVLTQRERASDPRQPVPRSSWRFETDTTISLADGFRPGWLYELEYEARDPLVLGLGFVAVRDLVAGLRRDPELGIEKCYAWGRSQSGRFLRDFVYQGFNRDASGQRVFDAVWPYVAGAGRLDLNRRFADPGRFSRQHEDHDCISDVFPYAYAACEDPATGRTDAILRDPETDPLVVHTDSSSEYWSRRASLVHTGPDGNDLEAVERVRLYLLNGAQHSLQLNEPAVAARVAKRPEPPSAANELPAWQRSWTPLLTNAPLRALLVALDAWATDGTPMPASRVPLAARGELVLPAAAIERFPSIPGAALPADANQLHGAVVKVPATDADGVETAGLKMPELAVPVGTYTGWNVRLAGCGGDDLASLLGSWFPFPATQLERRYPTWSDYLELLRQAAATLVDERLLLEEDSQAMLEELTARDRHVHD